MTAEATLPRGETRESGRAAVAEGVGADTWIKIAYLRCAPRSTTLLAM
jgi:hypothetical protein